MTINRLREALNKRAYIIKVTGIASIYIYLHLQMGEAFIRWIELYGDQEETIAPTIFFVMAILTSITAVSTWIWFKSNWIPTLSLTLLFMSGTLPIYTRILNYLVEIGDSRPLYDIINPGFTYIGASILVTSLYILLGGIESLFNRAATYHLHNRIWIAIDILTSLMIVLGGASILLLAALRFYDSVKGLLNSSPELVRGVLTTFLSSNLGFLVMVMIYLSIASYIIYSIVEPITLYISGEATQAKSILTYDLRHELRREERILRLRTIYMFIHGLPYLVTLIMSILLHIIYLNTIVSYYGDPISYIASITNIYSNNLRSFTNTGYSIIDPVINQSINQGELERAFEIIRGIIRFLVRLVF